MLAPRAASSVHTAEDLSLCTPSAGLPQVDDVSGQLIPKLDMLACFSEGRRRSHLGSHSCFNPAPAKAQGKGTALRQLSVSVSCAHPTAEHYFRIFQAKQPRSPWSRPLVLRARLLKGDWLVVFDGTCAALTAGVTLPAAAPQNVLRFVSQRRRDSTLTRLFAMFSQSEAPVPDHNAEHQEMVVFRIDGDHGVGDYLVLPVFHNAHRGLPRLATDAILDVEHHHAPHGFRVTKGMEVLAEAGNLLEGQRDLAQTAARVLVLPIHIGVSALEAFPPCGFHGIRDDELA